MPRRGRGRRHRLGLVVALWAAVDVVLGITYGVYRLAARRT